VLGHRERWGNAAVWTAAAAVTVTLLFAGFTDRPLWRRLVEQSVANIIFSGVCATLCVLVIPKVAPPARRLPFLLGWVLIAGTLVVLGDIGSVLAMGVAVAVQLVPANRFFEEWHPNSLRVSVYFTLIFGLAGTVIQELRLRLASTTLALRTTERDEAEARRLVAEAQLASLESRVDPHFLFNTLNSIAALVRDHPADAERVVEQLSSLMRASLDRRASLVPIDDELDIVRGYLEIERVEACGGRAASRISTGGGSSGFTGRPSSTSRSCRNSTRGWTDCSSGSRTRVRPRSAWPATGSGISRNASASSPLAYVRARSGLPPARSAETQSRQAQCVLRFAGF